MPFAELVDLDKEIERLEKEEEKLAKELSRVTGMLSRKVCKQSSGGEDCGGTVKAGEIYPDDGAGAGKAYPA